MSSTWKPCEELLFWKISIFTQKCFIHIDSRFAIYINLCLFFCSINSVICWSCFRGTGAPNSFLVKMHCLSMLSLENNYIMRLNSFFNVHHLQNLMSDYVANSSMAWHDMRLFVDWVLKKRLTTIAKPTIACFCSAITLTSKIIHYKSNVWIHFVI